MKKIWYLPVAAVIGATSLTVWGQANAGPPPGDSPGVVVTADVTSGQDVAKADDKGGLREDGVSDDGPTHDLNDDKGGLREGGDDKGGDR